MSHGEACDSIYQLSRDDLPLAVDHEFFFFPGESHQTCLFIEKNSDLQVQQAGCWEEFLHMDT